MKNWLTAMTVVTSVSCFAACAAPTREYASTEERACVRACSAAIESCGGGNAEYCIDTCETRSAETTSACKWAQKAVVECLANARDRSCVGGEYSAASCSGPMKSLTACLESAAPKTTPDASPSTDSGSPTTDTATDTGSAEDTASPTAPADTAPPPECTAGSSRCLAGAITSVETCVDGRWTKSTCGGMSACSQGSCKAVCDGYAPSGEVAVCVFPNADGVNDGVFTIATNPAQLSSADMKYFTAGHDGKSEALVNVASGTKWPYAWKSTRHAGLAFLLDGFAAPVNKVTLRAGVRRSGISTGATGQTVAFFNGTSPGLTSFFVYATPAPTSSWAPYQVYVPSTYTAKFNHTGSDYNEAMVFPTGEDSGSGPLYDALDINWMLLSVKQ
jgi:hypothetical protein